MDINKKKGKVFSIIEPTFLGGAIGIFVDYFADKDIVFTAMFAAVGLGIGIVKVCRKK